MNKNREMINIPYRPFLDVVFPKGGVITCKVVAVNEDGLKLESIHQENTTVTRATESQIKLFNKLHDSRVDDFKVFNKKSYRAPTR